MGKNTKEYYPPEKSHWEKYEIYYLVFGSFFFTTLIVLVSNSQNNEQIKKINRRLNDLGQTRDENDSPSSPSLPGNDDHNYKSGDFVFSDSKKQKENWLEEIVFQDEVRREFQIWVNSVKYLPKYRIGGQAEPERHALFYGPPGSGKSYLAEKFGENEAHAYISAQFGTETYAGSAKQKMNKVLAQAEYILKRKGQAKPVVIIIDEIDSVGRNNAHSGSASVSETKGIMTMIDEIKSKELNIIVIGITNYPKVLEPALIRTGRLGRQIKIPYPTKEEITKMVDYLEKDMKREQIGSYKYEGNKSKWDKDKDKEIEWTSDFWPNVHQITQEAFTQCQQEKVGISYSDLEITIKDILARKVGKDSKKITPQSSDYKEELQKKVNNKIRNKPKTRTPNRNPIPQEREDEEEDN